MVGQILGRHEFVDGELRVLFEALDVDHSGDVSVSEVSMYGFKKGVCGLLDHTKLRRSESGGQIMDGVEEAVEEEHGSKA